MSDPIKTGTELKEGEYVTLPAGMNAVEYIESLEQQVADKTDALRVEYKMSDALREALADAKRERDTLNKRLTELAMHLESEKETRAADHITAIIGGPNAPHCDRDTKMIATATEHLRTQLAEVTRESGAARREVNFKDNALLVAAEQLNTIEVERDALRSTLTVVTEALETIANASKERAAMVSVVGLHEACSAAVSALATIATLTKGER